MSAVLEAREPGAQYLEAPPALVRQFDLLVTASAGAARLRELVLTLAVQGRLVAQDSADEPASAILEQVGQVDSKKKLIGLRQEGRQRPTAPADPDRELPGGWICVRCSDLFKLRKGRVPSKLSDAPPGIPYLDIDALDRGLIKRYTSDQNCPTCSVDDILVVCDGSRSGLVLQGKYGAIGSTLAVIETPRPLQAYVKLIFREGFRRFNSGMKGAAIPHLDTKALFAEVVGLPPLAEQARIVARVDELMHLCDALEAKGRLEAEQHARLLGTLLGTLTDSGTPEELAANWQRVADHFDLLLDRPEAVDALEQTILLLAVRGLLVTQDAAEQPAIEALRRLQAQRIREEWEPRSRQAASSKAGAAADAPFGLPTGWFWAKAQELTSPSTIITYGVLKPEWVEVGVPTVRVQDIQEGKLLTDQVAQCLPARAEKFARTKLSEGDLLIAKDGATLGKTAFVPKALEGGNITQHVLRFSIAPSFNREYVRLVIDSPHGQAWMRGETQGVALPGVNVGDFRRMPIPVPPVGEQARIVARVAELRLLCAGLRQRLDRSGATQAALADALIDQALAT